MSSLAEDAEKLREATRVLVNEVNKVFHLDVALRWLNKQAARLPGNGPKVPQ